MDADALEAVAELLPAPAEASELLRHAPALLRKAERDVVPLARVAASSGRSSSARLIGAAAGRGALLQWTTKVTQGVRE